MRLSFLLLSIGSLLITPTNFISADEKRPEHPLLPSICSSKVWNPHWPTTAHDKILTGFSPLKCGMQRAPVVLTTIRLGGAASYAAFLTDEKNKPFLLVQDATLRRVDAQGNITWQYPGGHVAFYRQLHGDINYTLGNTPMIFNAMLPESVEAFQPGIREKFLRYNRLYKDFIRPLLSTCKVYHHAPVNATGGVESGDWFAMEFTSPDRRKGWATIMEANRRSFIKKSVATALFAAPAIQAADVNEKKLVVGLIGFGNRGKRLLECLDAIRGVEVAYICKPDSERRQEGIAFAEGAKPVNDFRHILDDLSIDGVLIATPDHWHAPAGLLAIAAGKHVYVEKPYAHNLREGVLLRNAANQSDKQYW